VEIRFTNDARLAQSHPGAYTDDVISSETAIVSNELNCSSMRRRGMVKTSGGSQPWQLEQISLGLNRRDSQRPANEGVSCP
jgi:hypothetical protein